MKNFVLRKQWGAVPPKGAISRPKIAVAEIYVHYSASGADEQRNHRNCAARVRGIQHYHMSKTPDDPTKPWADIAYSLLFCEHGWVFRGRGLGIIPAATYMHNAHSVAICFLGNDDVGRDDVTPPGRDALARAVAHTDRWRGKILPVKGHRDAVKTECPGDQLYEWIHTKAFHDQVQRQLIVQGGL
jgi:hypothetical protein